MTTRRPRRRPASTPLATLDLHHLWGRGKTLDGETYAEVRDQVLAHLRGEPCKFGHDGREFAALAVLNNDSDDVLDARLGEECSRVLTELGCRPEDYQ